MYLEMPFPLKAFLSTVVSALLVSRSIPDLLKLNLCVLSRVSDAELGVSDASLRCSINTVCQYMCFAIEGSM